MLNILKNENMLSARPQLSTQARQGFYSLKQSYSAFRRIE